MPGSCGQRVIDDVDHSIRRLQVALLLLRLSVFTVMFMWTLDKVINPAHTGAVFAHFYGIEGLPDSVMLAIALAECTIILCFLVGILRFWSYGAVLVLHTISTLSSFRQYLAPWEGSHLLFFAAWPMLAACVTLFILRDQDRLLSFEIRTSDRE